MNQRVSPAGKEKLREGWCGYLGPKSSRGGARAAPEVVEDEEEGL
jgi:hypothetical protein